VPEAQSSLRFLARLDLCGSFTPFEPEEIQAFTNQYIAFVNRIQYTSASYFLYQWQYFGEKYYDGKRQ